MRTIILLMIFVFLMEICMAKKALNYLKFGSCPEYKNCTTMTKNVVLRKDKQGKTVAIKFDLLVKKEIKRLMVSVTLMKCDNPENPDSCEYFIQNFKVKNACDVMGKENQSWSSGLSNSNFPKSCPIPAGTYKMNETKIDSNTQLTLMPVPIALWKLKAIAYDSGNDNVMVNCVDLHIQVYSERKH